MEKQNGAQYIAAGMLDEINSAVESLKEIQAAKVKEYEAINSKYDGKINEKQQGLRRLEKELEAYGIQRRAEIFGEADRVDLPPGALLYQQEMHLRRARTVLPALEDQGMIDLIKVKKSVDWDKLAEMSDDFLGKVGTERTLKEKIQYERAESA